MLEVAGLYYVLSTAFCLIYIWKPKDDFNSHMDGIIFLIIGWAALPFYVIRLLIHKKWND